MAVQEEIEMSAIGLDSLLFIWVRRNDTRAGLQNTEIVVEALKQTISKPLLLEATLMIARQCRDARDRKDRY